MSGFNTLATQFEMLDVAGIPVHLYYSIQYITAHPVTKVTCNCSKLMVSKMGDINKQAMAYYELHLGSNYQI